LFVPVDQLGHVCPSFAQNRAANCFLWLLAVCLPDVSRRNRRSFLFIVERIKIKDRVKGWRGWREYIGLMRQQSAMVGIFMHKKRIHDMRCIVMAWKDQIRFLRRFCRRFSRYVTRCLRIGLALRYKVLGEERVQVQRIGRRKFWQEMKEQGKLDVAPLPSQLPPPED
jgi:hypothetical protein